MRSLVLVALLVALFLPSARAEEDTAPSTRMPVREVTVFKDGHAFVLHADAMPVNEDGHVVLKELPAPVLGTFWPYANEKDARLRAVRSGTETIPGTSPAADMRTLLAVNVGAKVIVTDVHDRTFAATILRAPIAVQVPYLLLETPGGRKAMPLDQIRDIVFQDEMEDEAPSQTFENRLTLELEWTDERAKVAQVGMMYLQKGLRWIPNYAVDLGDDGKAVIRLQATLVNDLIDLEDVRLNLVVGVPTFAFAHITDPIALQQVLAQVSQRMSQQALTNRFASNAIMSQSARASHGVAAAAPADGEMTGASRQEDLYVFDLEHVTLRKGERMVVPIAETTVAYENLYSLTVPFSPPVEAWPTIAQRLHQNPQEAEAARLMAAPKVMHEVRLTNAGPHPFTTAPALVLRAGRVLAQGMLTYTSVGGTVDLPVTNAVDVNVQKKDREIGRTPKAGRWRGDDYARADMEGTVRATNYKSERIRLRVTRFVLGNAKEADHDGEVSQMNALEDSSWASWSPPIWWRWYSWPHWWYRFNSVARIEWDVEVDAGETISLGYTWDYYWL